MRISWRADQLDPPRPIFLLPENLTCHQRFNRRADEKACETARAHRATRTERLEEPWHTQPNASRPREAKIATNG